MLDITRPFPGSNSGSPPKESCAVGTINLITKVTEREAPRGEATSPPSLPSGYTAAKKEDLALVLSQSIF